MPYSKRETIVVDFLNFGIIPIINSLNSKKNILLIYLFPTNQIVEILIKKLLRKKKIDYEYIPFNSKQTYKEQTNLADEITHEFLKDCHLKQLENSNYLDMLVGNIFYKKIYKILSPYIFIKSLKLKNYSIYFQNSSVDNLIDKYFKFKNLKFYSSYGRLVCTNYFFEYHKKEYSFFKLLRNIFKLFCILFFLFKSKLPKSLKNKPSLFLNQFNKSLNTNIYDQFKKYDYSFIKFNDPFKISFNKINYDIRHMKFSDINYIRNESSKLFKKLEFCNLLNINDKIFLLREYFDIIFIKNFLEEIKPCLFYSNYESKTCLIFQNLAKKHNCVTIASTSSYGYFPQKYEGGHLSKFCDIYFVWGKKHSDLILNSNDLSNYHIISGKTEKVLSQKIIKYNYKKLICLSDNSFYDDLYLNKEEFLKTLNLCIKFAKKYDYKIVIKTKKYRHIYTKIVENNFDIIIDIDDNIDSLLNYPQETIFLGYSLFSIGVNALRKNSIALFYDKYNLMWEDIVPHLKNFIIKDHKNIFETIKLIADVKVKKSRRSISEVIDFNIDDSNKLIVDYIISYLQNLSFSKDQTINKANKIHELKWGPNTIIFKRSESNFKFKTFYKKLNLKKIV